MKVTGPGSGAPTEAPGGAKEASAPSGKKFAEAVDKKAGAEAQAGTAPVERAQSVSDIAAELQAGRITPQTAVERVIDRVLDRQLGADAPAAMRDKVGAALREALASDPMLAAKLRGLGA